MITLNDYLSASGKYPERLKSSELTAERLINAKYLLERVNAFLAELGVSNVKVSSGFRPAAVNSAIPNAAKKSLHMECRAVDIEDKDGSLDKIVNSRDDLKKKYGLWQEHPDATNGWCHIDDKDRGPRANNRFVP